MANNGKGIGPNRLGASKGSVSSPAKKNGMKYDIKEASNQSLSASARKN